MADDSSRDEEAAEAPPEGAPSAEDQRLVESDAETGIEAVAGEPAAALIGVERYVHAAFLAAAVIAAYVLGKVLHAGWNRLMDWPEAVRQFPALLEYTEDQRGSVTLLIGAVLGALIVLRYYRRPFVRNWATGVAGELSRVTWPSKDAVTSGTVVVLVAGAVATFYVAVLDRLWGYLTNLVYGT
jgi:preprotein translocase subunit SecE